MAENMAQDASAARSAALDALQHHSSDFLLDDDDFSKMQKQLEFLQLKVLNAKEEEEQNIEQMRMQQQQ